MANYDVETRISDVLVHITYPENKTKDITITGYAIHKKPRCKVDGMKECRKVAETKKDIEIVVERVVNAVIDKYLNKERKIILSNKTNVIDLNTRIGRTFIELKQQDRGFYKDWGDNTRRGYLAFYERNVIPVIQWCNTSEDFGKVEFYDLAEMIAERTLKNANFEGTSLEEAKEKTIAKMNYAYPIFSEMRYMDPGIPDLYLNANEFLFVKRGQKEQKKYIPPKIHKAFRELLEKDIETRPLLVLAAVLMENCALRTNEAAGWTWAFGEEFDNHFIVWILVQGKKQSKILKSKKGYRFVITDDWGYAMLTKCQKIIETGELTETITDTQLCNYIKDKLNEAGLSKEFITEAGNELQESKLQGRNKEFDVAAYILRRNRASIWRNYCGYSQDELDYCLGHISVKNKAKEDTTKNKAKEDMWKIEKRKLLSEKNRRFDLSPEVSQSPKYNPIDVSDVERKEIIPFPAYRFINNGDKPICVKVHAVTSEAGEAVVLVHKDGMESEIIGNNAITTNGSKRSNTEIIGNVENEIK